MAVVIEMVPTDEQVIEAHEYYRGALTELLNVRPASAGLLKEIKRQAIPMQTAVVVLEDEMNRRNGCRYCAEGSALSMCNRPLEYTDESGFSTSDTGDGCTFNESNYNFCPYCGKKRRR